MSEPLLHLIVPADWRGDLSGRALVPPSLHEQGFVHLSTAEQVALPAGRLFHGRRDLMLLVLDPAKIGVPVKWEPGLPTDPASMRFPHAYGPVPTGAVLAVLPYRPRPDGGFDAPIIPNLDDASRATLVTPSLLRRVATAEVPVTGGVAVITEPVPHSYQHNQLLIDLPVDAATVVADADRVLGEQGLAHRAARVSSDRTAAGLAAFGWSVEQVTVMAARAGGPSLRLVRDVGIDGAHLFREETWLRALPGANAGTIEQLVDRYELEQEVIDVRCLGVVEDGHVVAACLLKIDGATAVLDTVETAPEHRRRGLGDAMVAEALAVAGQAGCDVVTLDAPATDWPRRWYARHGFADVDRRWQATLSPINCNSL